MSVLSSVRPVEASPSMPSDYLPWKRMSVLSSVRPVEAAERLFAPPDKAVGGREGYAWWAFA